MRRRARTERQRLVEAQGIGNSETGVSIDFDTLLITENDLFGRRLQRQEARVVVDHAVDERHLIFKPGSPATPIGLPSRTSSACWPSPPLCSTPDLRKQREAGDASDGEERKHLLHW